MNHREKEIRWGMIGTGDVTERKSGPAFNKVPGSRLVAVSNRTLAKAESYGRRHGIGKVHADPLELIHDPEVDAIYVATPPDAHRNYAMACIAAGKPVYLEKPMARTHEECLAINKAADEAGVPVYVAYYRRSLEYFRKVKELAESCRLGRILHIRMMQYFAPREEDLDPDHLPWRVIPEISGGGYFHDMGCHALDILFYIFGDPVQVSGHALNRGRLYEADDTVTASLVLGDGIALSAGWSFVTPVSLQKDRIVVTGEHGSLSFSVFSFETIRMRTRKGTEEYDTVQPDHIQMPFIENMVAELQGHGHCPSNGHTGAVTSKVMDQICGTC
jgi:predicted dehydrogenase